MPAKAELWTVCMPLRTGEQTLTIEVGNAGDVEGILFVEVSQVPAVPWLPGIAVTPETRRIYSDTPVTPGSSWMFTYTISLSSSNYTVGIEFGHTENTTDISDGKQFIYASKVTPSPPPPEPIVPMFGSILDRIRSLLRPPTA